MRGDEIRRMPMAPRWFDEPDYTNMIINMFNALDPEDTLLVREDKLAYFGILMTLPSLKED